MSDPSETLLSHLEALRSAIISILAATAALYPAGYWASGHVIGFLTGYCLPDGVALHYFAPMEAFWVRLKVALVLSLVMAYPWNAWQAWRFLLPALYETERRALGRWIIGSTLLFLAGVAFCVGVILPLLMRFAISFASDGLTPVFGLAALLGLAGWLAISFGLMFQMPLAAMLAVRFGIISRDALARTRPYVVVSIFILAALLTPPDIVSQLLLGLPTWLLFELGLLFSRDRRHPPGGKDNGGGGE